MVLTMMKMANYCQNFNCQDSSGFYIVVQKGMFTIKAADPQKFIRRKPNAGGLLTQHLPLAFTISYPATTTDGSRFDHHHSEDPQKIIRRSPSKKISLRRPLRTVERENNFITNHSSEGKKERRKEGKKEGRKKGRKERKKEGRKKNFITQLPP